MLPLIHSCARPATLRDHLNHSQKHLVPTAADARPWYHPHYAGFTCKQNARFVGLGRCPPCFQEILEGQQADCKRAVDAAAGMKPTFQWQSQEVKAEHLLRRATVCE